MRISFVEGCGFVFGTLSLVEKTIGGLALMLIQNQMPDPVTEDNGEFFASIVAYGCGGTALFGIVIVLILWPFKLSQRK